jgi:DNA-binding CsgD family transcriptional regulator
MRIVEDALAHYSLDRDNIATALEALRELLDTDKVVLYTLEPHPNGSDLRLGRNATVRVPEHGWRASFDDYLTGRGVSWGTYNGLTPEPSQRDRVLDTSEISALSNGRTRDVEAALSRRLDAVGHDTLRVLVTDGVNLLAWVGILQPQKTSPQQRELFARVVPAFRKRLVFDRLVSRATLASGAAVAALEHVNGAAWLLGPSGSIDHANAAARAQLDRDRAGTLASLGRCLAGVAAPRYSVTPLRSSHGPAGHVVVEPVARATADGIVRAATRLGLTPAQTRVLERLARGASNATIAAELTVAERTVEAHVTAILDKAQVPSRAALIVQIFA